MSFVTNSSFWRKSLIGAAVAVAALAMGATAVVASADSTSNLKPEQTTGSVVSARSFKAVKAQPAAATTPKMDLAWYAADKDGKVADNAQPLTDGRTNASNVRLGVTITGFDGFPAGQFDRNGQYEGADKDKIAFTVTVGILGVKEVKYGDFHRTGNVQDGYTYTVEPNDGPAFALSGEPVTLDVTVAAPADPTAADAAIDLNQFKDGDGTSTITAPQLSYDSTKPAAVDTAVFGDVVDTDWLKGKDKDATDGTWFTTTSPSVTFTPVAAEAANVVSYEVTYPNGNGTKTDTVKADEAWTVPNGKTDLTKTTVTVTNWFGSASDAKPLSDLLDAKTVIVDPNAGTGLSLNLTGTTPDKGAVNNGTTYYSKVGGFSVSSTSAYFADELALLKANGIKLLTVPAADGTGAPTPVCDAADLTNGAVDCGDAGLDLKPGNHTVSLNSALPGAPTVTQSFAIDTTAPTVAWKGYSKNGGIDIPFGKTLFAVGRKERALTFTVTDDGAGVGKVIASGIDPETGKQATVTLTNNGDGTYTFPLTKAGTYDLTDFTIQATDNAGTQSKAEKVNAIAGDKFTYTKIRIGKNVQPKTTVSVSGTDYINGTPKVTLTVKNNPWLADELKGLQEGDGTKNLNLLTSTLTAGGKTVYQGAFPVAGATVNDAGDKIVIAADAAKPLIDAKNTNGQYAITVTKNLTLLAVLGDVTNNAKTFGVDTQAPSFTGAAYQAGRDELTSTKDDSISVVSRSAATITLDARDLLPDSTATGAGKDDAQTSGLAKVEAKVDYTTWNGDKVTGKWTELQRVNNDPNKVQLTLGDQDGKYTLAGVSLRATDKATTKPNVSDAETTLATVKAALAKSTDTTVAAAAKQLPDTLGVSKQTAKATLQLNDADPQNTYKEDLTNISLKVAGDPAFAYRWDVVKAGYADANLLTGAVQYGDAGSKSFTFKISDATYKDSVITLGTANLPKRTETDKDATGKQFNGDYQLTLQKNFGNNVELFNAQSTGTTNYLLDTKRPVLTKISGPAGAKGETIVDTTVQGKSYTVFAKAGAQTFTVWIKDLLPNGQSSNDSAKNEAHTSGIKDDSVKLTIPDGTDLKGKTLAEGKTVNVTLDNEGKGQLTLDQEGFYDLSKITVSVNDNLGNALDKESFKKAPVQDNVKDYDAVVADVNGNDTKASFAVTKSDNSVPDSSDNNNKYFRGKVKVAYTITDHWFPIYAKLNAGKTNLLAGSTSNTTPLTGGQNEQNIKPLDASDAQWTEGDGYTWTLSGQKLLINGKTNEVEGNYTLHLAYAGLQAKANEASTQSKDVVLDWTAPKLGDLTASSEAPKKWDWIFSTDVFTATLNGISDNVSGVTADSTAFSTKHFDNWLSGKNDPAPVYAGDAAAGSISFTMDGDSQRVYLGETSLTIRDEAGNPVDTGKLNAYEGVNGNQAANALKGLNGVAIDTVAPTIAVSYDNNDVRNGKYYKAHRTGTVTLTESNFDFSKKYEGDRVVVTTSVDGKKATIPVSSFKNASGDLKTYVATFAADSDGDWTVDAAYTDPGDHPSNTIHEEFTVDTVAPKLTLTFDNNNVKNGKYYAADRNATIREVERNFSKDESVITVTAKDDNGADTAAPGPAGWQRTGGTRESTEWTNSVAFTGEAHFTIKATATDLAGNKAEEVSEPEFVVDKTKPQIKIDRVEDKTAYAGTVAPLIDFNDVNIDMKNVSYTLVGDHRGELKGDKMPKNVTTDAANDRTVDFTDFERKVDFDDVYTIKAHGTDLAGNTFETKKTFSVNRFGSTYTFDADTTNLRGTYLKKAQDVQITEINVSGLDLSKRQIVIAKDDKATTLTNNDYKVATSDDKGWSRTVYTVPASRFNSDGFYRVQVQSMDEAGNLSQNTMDKKNADRKGTAEVNFAVDSTAPTASLLGIKSGTVYYSQQGQPASVDAKDNLGIKSTEVYVDGQLKDSWKGDATLKSTPSLTFDADAKSHEIVIHTIDKAGNEATSTYDNIYVASNWWQYATHTPWLRNTMIFGALVVLAAIAGAIVAVNQRRKQFAYRKNPFER